YGARENYETALKIVQDAVRQPDATVYERSMLSAAHQNLGDVLGNPDDLNLGDQIGAISHYRTAIAIDEALAAADPQDVRARDGLADTYRGFGAILVEGQPAEAHKLNRQAVAISEGLSKAEPSNTKYRHDVALGKMGSGEALHKLGKNREALQELAPALELMKALSGTMVNQISLIGDVGRIHRDIGNVLLVSGDEEGALEHYRQAVAETEELARRAPSNLYFQRQHADSLEALGRYYLRLAQRQRELKKEARSWLQRGLAVWQDWTRREVATPYAAARQDQATRYLASCDRL